MDSSLNSCQKKPYRSWVTIQQKIDPGKVQIIVLDGNQGTAHVLDAPEHSKTVIQTVKGSFARVDHEIGYKVR
ncbi:hypothetical protein C7B63_02220 [Bacillus halotolerans]|uniref:XtrA/YqaO family protein n=1 Tax=Bacillus halotolerans TaxID=260554 RepID=UPI000D0143DF|nr:XtrA/YqaO family protein [Bacillus halotolerans]PRP52777.1 hypothetical protein C7B63_02220 [Bacillus halotolerans]PRP60280.1 hypothetical protein C7B66_04940 [Bacillus halotolerans]PRP64945.1 hypothetical protein C7B72_04935 [Bacillus halotolerans]